MIYFAEKHKIQRRFWHRRSGIIQKTAVKASIIEMPHGFCSLMIFFFFCILFIYFLFTGIVQTTYRSKHTNITKFTTTTLITKKKRKENRIIK